MSVSIARILATDTPNPPVSYRWKSLHRRSIEANATSMNDQRTAAPESTAVRVALWRAMHVQVDPPPHVLEDEIGLRLVAPDKNWRDRPDMDPKSTSSFRASIVARARFIEDLVIKQA